MSGLESGVSLCVQAISPKCLACHDYSPVDFGSLWFLLHSFRGKSHIFHVKS